MNYRIGIDAGSKTIKLVVIDEAGVIVHYAYRRHRSNIRRTLVKLLEDFIERYGNFEGRLAVTGSAGIALAGMLGLPFVQEVIATTTAVKSSFPQADVIVELGGEDAKVVYLSGKPEQRMNATCAGGTGGFIDTMAGMLGVRAAELNQLAARSRNEYPIASRCAVFAQTDVRPLLAAGVSKEDIAASALSAVVRQTLGGLACGRPLRGTVVFLGGPLEYLPELARRFREALGLDESTGIRPEQAHLFTARGAALSADALAEVPGADAQDVRGGACSGNHVSLARILQLVVENPLPDDGLERLAPLFENEEQRREFRERHAAERMPRARIFECKGPLYLGFDAGSTTVKYALVNDEGKLVYYGYRASEGNVLETALVMLSELYKTIPPTADVYLAQSVAVGYGDEMLRAALRIDADAVETTAHLRAAQHLRPDATFVLDIGGQDMKALWVKNGQIVDAILNEACSSGCGSFIEGTARSLNMTRQGFSTAALESAHPLDLGTKCTVFMTSRVRHAQKAGADERDIAAGIAYSVVMNALYRVIGRDRSADMGDVVIACGGAFKSDAVLRAFEKVAGVQAVRPDVAHLMGAIGAALIARDRAHDAQRELERAGKQGRIVSEVMGPDELSSLVPHYSTRTCPGCPNSCTLSIVEFGDGRMHVSGNRCSKGAAFATGLRDGDGDGADAMDGLPRMRKHRRRRNRTEAGFNPLINATWESIARSAGASAVEPPVAAGERGRQARLGSGAASERATPPKKIKIVAPRHYRSMPDALPDTLAFEMRELERYGSREGSAPFGAVRVGLLLTLCGQELLPFWHALFAFLGFGIAQQPQVDGVESDVEQPACVPVALACKSFEHYADAGVQVVFVPRFDGGVLCQAAESCIDDLFARVEADNSLPRIASPLLHAIRPEVIPRDEASLRALHEALADLVPMASLSYERVLDAVRLAYNEQREFEKRLFHGVDNAMVSVRDANGARGVVLATRPCHMSPSLMRPLVGQLSGCGRAVITSLGFEHYIRHSASRMPSFDPTLSGHGSPGPLDSDAAWRGNERLLSFAEHAVEYQGLDVLFVESSSCEYDEDSRDELECLHDPDERPMLRVDIAAPQIGGLIARADEAHRVRVDRDDRRGQQGSAPKDEDVEVFYASQVQGFVRDGSQAPNVVAYLQDRMASYASVEPTLRTARIGLPCTLTAWEQTPFWHALFKALGFGVVVADALPGTLRSAAAESVPSESVCEPAKITHARLFALQAAGADAVLLVRYERGGRCPVMCGYTDALLDNVEFLSSGDVRVIAPRLRSADPLRFGSDSAQVDEIYRAVAALDEACTLTHGEFDAAFAVALEEQKTFLQHITERTREALAWVEAGGRRGGIVVAGRPYHADPDLMHGIDEVVQRLGFAVLPALGLGVSAMRTEADSSWKPGKHLLRLARFVIAHPALDLVVLQSFGCGYDAITLGDVREELTGAGRTFTALKVDEIVDTAHIRIRLRTMAEAIAGRRRRELLPEGGAQPSAEAPGDASGNGGRRAREGAGAAVAAGPVKPLFERGVSQGDLETARSSAPADTCFTLAATVAHVLNCASEDVALRFVVPPVCRKCMIDAVPHLAARIGCAENRIDWEAEPYGQLLPPAADGRPLETGPSAVRVGIVGNPLLVFDPYMNEGVAGLLERLGAQVVWPKPENLYVDDVRYLEQLDLFHGERVDAVLYLQSFGCLKGHVQARGAAHYLARRYPDMPVTVLDYDPESSALNRENRIRLAVAAAREARMSKGQAS